MSKPKACAKCGKILTDPQLAPDEPERCWSCADGTYDCEHALDLRSMQVAWECKIEVVDGRLEFVMDIQCSKCGQSGGMPITVKLSDVDW
jgi:hypothetical protein